MRLKIFAFTVFLALVIVNPSPTALVKADVPTVLEIKRVKEGTETFLEILARHSGPTSSHYVDAIEVEIDGKVEEVAGLDRKNRTIKTISFFSQKRR